MVVFEKGSLLKFVILRLISCSFRVILSYSLKNVLKNCYKCSFMVFRVILKGSLGSTNLKSLSIIRK